MPDLDTVSAQLAEIAALLRNHLEQNQRQTNLLRDEFMENRKLGRDLVVSLQDLRGELEHVRTKPERDDRIEQLERRVNALEPLAALGG